MLNSTFTIPTTALLGTTRLRVVMSNDPATTSCGSSYGETEDYSLLITTPPLYCASQGNPIDAWIALVSIGSIHRSSSRDGGYYDGTAISTSVVLGSMESILYSSGLADIHSSRIHWKIYIDYNQDGDFTDSDEMVASNSSSNYGGPWLLFSGFTIPTTARLGITRLRVVMGSNDASSCGTFNSETEDYSLLILPPPNRTLSHASARLATPEYGVYPNPATDVLTISAPAGRDVAKLNVRVHDLRGAEQPQARYGAKGQLDVSGLSKGVYLLTITDGQQVSHQRFVKE
jgi:hypothetical protein